ncbi:alpha-L-fucosidase [Fodinibius salsisoli]|uniref:alpha-L-fucosidase n=1 Tax=Fodinibius salsisoli TaxID=2820877 RepID=A0ABT3PQ81_9BACT|nr:alpha-L-fucosidase [Fodinibius salsisoli]MCW9707991.1 alpha-L-fucosidase [Fodinibius salsisoli]
MNYRFTLLPLLIAVFVTISTVHGQENESLKYGSQYEGKRQDEAMQKFRENRLGQFIHWGLYAIPGGKWDGKIYPGAAEWLQSWADVPPEEWSKLINQWNPDEFDAQEWAHMAKEAGFKYMTVTTKHHEGFCLWPSEYTDFDVASAPNKTDIMGELIDAYTKVGIDVYFYYSILDWHHPDWRYDIKSEEDEQAFERYKTYVDNQLTELVERYPEVKGFWFDGTWDKSVKKNGKWTLEIQQMLKSLKPGMIVNSRLRADDHGSRHFDSNDKLMGDYESGYERRLPSFREDTIVTTRDWEAVMTVPENQWGYHQDWSVSHVKSTNEVLEWITHSVAMGGNMLVNIGPKPDGTIRQQEKTLMKEIEQWMDINGEAIYAGDYLGWEKQDWGYYIADQKTNEVYALVFNVPVTQKITVATPEGISIEEAHPLKDESESLKISEKGPNEVFIHLPQPMFEAPYVIKLKVSGKDGSKGTYRKAKT